MLRGRNTAILPNTAPIASEITSSITSTPRSSAVIWWTFFACDNVTMPTAPRISGFFHIFEMDTMRQVIWR
jgi:hypothetical protein